jgi:hypothetical protein
MNVSHGIKRAVWALLCIVAFPAPSLRAASSSEITAVSSRVFNGYRRTTLADGSFRPETYGLAIGGFLSRSPAALEGPAPASTRDGTIDYISFASIARAIEDPLAVQKYVPTGEPKTADLLIVVFWGRTIGTNAFAGSGMSQTTWGVSRDKIDAQNARLLGFDAERVFDQGFDDPANMMSNIRKQVYSGTIDAIEDDRYFIILQAFDFQSAWKQRKINLLWETRFSLSQRHHDFGKDLPRMAQVASQFFGQDSHGLINKEIPSGQVDVGQVKSLGEAEEPKK